MKKAAAIALLCVVACASAGKRRAVTPRENIAQWNYEWARGAGVKNGNVTGIANVLREVVRLYPGGIIDAPFLTNHDHTRIATILGDDPRKLRNAAAILLTLPGRLRHGGTEEGMSCAKLSLSPQPHHP